MKNVKGRKEEVRDASKTGFSKAKDQKKRRGGDGNNQEREGRKHVVFGRRQVSPCD